MNACLMQDVARMIARSGARLAVMDNALRLRTGPTPLLDDEVAALRGRKTELLGLLAGQEWLAATPAQKRVQAARRRGHPVPAQAAAVRLRGRLDAARLAEAMGLVAAAHPILRTSLCDLGGEIVQVVALDAAPPGLQRFDFRRLDPTAAAVEAVSRIVQAAECLDRPMQGLLIELGPDDHVFAALFDPATADSQGAWLALAAIAAAYGDRGAAVADETRDYGRFAATETLRQPPARQDAGPPMSAAGWVPVDAPAAASPALALASLAVLAARMTHNPAIAVEIVTDGRAVAGLDGVLGNFSRHEPVSLTAALDASLADLLRQAEAALAGRHGAAEPGRLALTIEPPSAPILFSGLATERFVTPIWQSEDLCLRIGAGGTWRLAYRRDGLAGLADGLGRALSLIAAEAGRAPDTAIEAVRLIAGDDPGRPAAARYPEDRSLTDLFAARVGETPDAPAVTCGELTLTYAEIDLRASAIATRLRAEGVGAGTLVAVMLPRGHDQVAAILGVLKTGGAYVPIDPDYPPDRIAFLLEDSRAPVALVADPGAAAGGSARAIPIAEALAGPARSVTGAARPEDAAYVIYTSGTTGRPKGVIVEHRNVVALLFHRGLPFDFGPDDSWTLFHSVSFDFSVWEMFGALLHGGRLVIVPNDVARDPEAFLDLLARERVTVLNAVPSYFSHLDAADAAGPRDLAVRLLVFGGEALQPALLDGFCRRHSRTRVVNMFGITETTVHVTHKDIGRREIEAGLSNIGRCLGSHDALVLAPGMRPVPAGVAGELYVGGAGVARGYLDRPELTAQRFVDDPLHPGRRLYRTGDLVRCLANGDLEYLGRLDRQVKIRGYRIELGEVEAALAGLPGVSGAVVTAAGAPEPRLTAYVASRADPAVLRELLARRLPSFMLPSALVRLDRLPLTANGKVDRAALPAPEAVAAAAADETWSETERAVADLFRSVLDIRTVGLDDSLFDLGGDSLISIRLTARARKIGLQLDLSDLYAAPTVRGLAMRVQSLSGTDRPAAAPFDLLSEADRRRLPADAVDAYPLSRAQAGMLYQIGLAGDVPLYHNVSGLVVRLPLEPDLFEEAIARTIQAHPMLRTSFALSGYSEPLQIVHRTVETPFAWREAPEDEVLDAWFEREAASPFDPARLPLIRFTAFHRGGDVWHIFITESHVVIDGWSMGTVIDEIFARYSELAGLSVEPEPEAPRCFYRDYLDLERAALASAETRRFWAALVADPPAPTLPRRAGAPAGEARVHHLPVPLPAGLTERLRGFASDVGVPLKSVLQAAHLKVLSVLGDQDRVVTGVATNVRPERDDGERVVGLFLNTLPLIVDLGLLSWAELVGAAAAAEQAGTPHRYFPLAEIQAAAGRQALFNTLFNFAHFHNNRSLLRRGGLEVLGRTQSFGQTEMALIANFTVDVPSSELELTLAVDSARLSPEQAAVIGGCYVRALTAMVETPDASHAAAAPLADGDVERLLALGDGGPSVPAEHALLHRLVEAQCARTPAAVALSHDGRTMSYAELNRAADELAGALAALGAGPERLVGICLKRTPRLVVALLAVLKAGTAYVPMDPAYPGERLAIMAGDAQLTLIVADSATRASLPALDIPVLDLDGESPAGVRPRPLASTQSLAYVLYTSGSTGRPKGVAITHGSATAFVAWSLRVFGGGALDAVLASTSISFDLSVFEIFATLAAGGRIVLVDSILDLARCAEPLTLINTVPSAAAELVNGGLMPKRPCIVNLAGEPFAPALVEALYDNGARAVYNLYGPTEDTTYSTFIRLERGERHISIGRPLSGTRAVILDRHFHPVPEGVAGQLLLGGAGLARGYWRRPSRTAESFLPDPFGPPGSRLYRTGDLAAWNADGSLAFLGRTDHQIKLRGFRIELGEIEAALSDCAQVERAVVEVQGEGADRRLVAFVVAKAGRPFDKALATAELRRLAPHMVPSAFMLLDALPLTPNGKVDRKALPRTSAAASAPGGADATSRVSALWRELLGRAEVGADETFFDAGGNSLLLLRLHARLKAEFDEAPDLAALFHLSTIEAQARHLSGASEQVRAAAPAGAAADDAIAIVGMAGRFPGADDVDRFWENLQAGVESIATFGEDELRGSGVPEAVFRRPDYVPRGGAIDGVDLFDNELFRVTPRDAALMDPQQRHLLECAWTVLEHAGHDPARFGGRVGVFVGTSFNQFLVDAVMPVVRAEGPDLYAAMLNNAQDFAASRIAFKLDLTGPAMTVQTACSTGLATVHTACESLRSGACDMAIAGGASLHAPQKAGYVHQPGHIMSRDGRVRAFDADASGTVNGSGVALVALRRLKDALADGDRIHAVILGSAANNDGAGKMAFIAPSRAGQVAVIRAAQKSAGVTPDEIGYVEAHGTGTALGDAVEFAALREVFPAGGPGCLLGSVKTNIGHLDVAAGTAGLIKAACIVRDGVVPASLHFRRPHPELRVEASALRVAAARQAWPPGRRRVAGVSALGVGGTNVHAVVAEPPPAVLPTASRGAVLMPISAADPGALRELSRRLSGWVAGNPDDLACAAYTLQVGRKELPIRAAIVAATAAEAAALLERVEPGGTLGDADPALRRLAAAWVGAEAVDWSTMPRLRRIALPTYPFQRRRHWPSEILPSARRDGAGLLDLVARCWREVLGFEEIDPDRSFFDLNGDSLAAAEIAAALTGALGRPVSLNLLVDDVSIRSLAAAIERDEPPALPLPLVRLQSGTGGPVPLFMPAPLGGHVLFYRHLARALGPDFTVIGLESVGLDGDEPPLHDLPAIAARYLAAMRQVQPAGPYALAGSSFGGAVCFELARQLRRRGETVALAAMLDTPAAEDLPEWLFSDAKMMLVWADEVAAGHDLTLAELESLADDRRLDHLNARIGAFDPHARLDPRIWAVIAANFNAMRNYRPEPCSDPVVYLQARERRDGIDPADPVRRWREVAPLEFDIVGGNHITMNSPPNVAAIADILRAKIPRI